MVSPSCRTRLQWVGACGYLALSLSLLVFCGWKLGVSLAGTAETQAIVTNSTLELYSCSDYLCDDENNCFDSYYDCYRVDLDYQYEVAQTNYSGHHTESYTNKGYAQRYYDAHPIGSHLTVFYNKENPVIHELNETGVYLGYLLGVLLFACALVCALLCTVSLCCTLRHRQEYEYI